MVLKKSIVVIWYQITKQSLIINLTFFEGVKMSIGICGACDDRRDDFKLKEGVYVDDEPDQADSSPPTFILA